MLSRVKLIVSVIVIALAFGVGWTANGWRLNNKYNKEKAATLKAYSALSLKRWQDQVRLQERVDELASTLEHEQHDRAAKEKDLIRQVADYRERYRRALAAGTAVCPHLGDGWVRIHDNALPRNAIPNPTGTAADDAGTALETVTHNYTVLDECLAKLQGWQDWYEGIKNPARGGVRPNPQD